MAALASPPVSGNMPGPPSGIHREPRSSAFTAVNGSYGSGSKSETNMMGDTITVQTENQSYEHSQSSSRPTPPPSRQENPYVDYRNETYNNHHHQLPSPTDTASHGTKRKREDSPSAAKRVSHGPDYHWNDNHPEGDIRPDYEQRQYRQPTTERVRESQSDEKSESDDRSNHESRATSQNSPDDNQREPYIEKKDSYQEHSPSNSDRANRTLPHLNGHSRWAPSASYPAMYSNDPPTDHADHQMRHSAQRELENHEQSQSEWGFQSGSNDAGEGEDSNYADSIHAQLGPKRKRNFSNRTKTGCITCRKRKKKCDEGHPFCQNCQRGGFKCEGYSGRTHWPKPNNPKVPVPLQSKEGYPIDQDNRYSIEGQSPHPGQPQLPPMNHVNQPQPPPPPPPPPPPRPLAHEQTEPSGGRYMASPASATATAPQQPYPPAWPVNAHPPYQPERPPKADYRDLPPLHNPNRIDHVKDYGSVPPISEISRAPPGSAHPASAMSWPNPSPSEGRMTYAPPSAIPPPSAAPPPSIEAQHMGRPTLGSRERPPPLPLHLSEETEKDKMIGCRLFKFMDPQLQEERDRCKAALWRLNNAGNPAFGIHESERQRLLKQVLQPPNDMTNMSPAPRLNPRGSIGPNAKVELPFQCQYGYNIHIGENAYIGENCSIIDACTVKIGAKTWIGSNVQILTAMAHTDLQHRSGANSSWQGKEVIIEEDVYVGAGTLIYPGVRLARGAYVEPGSTVKEDLGEYKYSGYKPVYLSHGVPS